MTVIIDEIRALLDLFEDKVPDRETNRLVSGICHNPSQWNKARELFSIIRKRNLEAIQGHDKVKEAQYCFEEVIVETLYNLTRPQAPFDLDTPYWIIKNALCLAKRIGLPTEVVVDIVI